MCVSTSKIYIYIFIENLSSQMQYSLIKKQLIFSIINTVRRRRKKTHVALIIHVFFLSSTFLLRENKKKTWKYKQKKKGLNSFFLLIESYHKILVTYFIRESSNRLHFFINSIRKRPPTKRNPYLIVISQFVLLSNQ